VRPEGDNTEHSPHLGHRDRRAQTLDRMFLLISVIGGERRPIGAIQTSTYRYLVVLS
jgi:hypothetical protein